MASFLLSRWAWSSFFVLGGECQGFALGEGDGEGTDTAGEVYSDGVVEMVARGLWRNGVFGACTSRVGANAASSLWFLFVASSTLGCNRYVVPMLF